MNIRKRAMKAAGLADPDLDDDSEELAKICNEKSWMWSVATKVPPSSEQDPTAERYHDALKKAMLAVERSGSHKQQTSKKNANSKKSDSVNVLDRSFFEALVTHLTRAAQRRNFQGKNGLVVAIEALEEVRTLTLSVPFATIKESTNFNQLCCLQGWSFYLACFIFEV